MKRKRLILAVVVCLILVVMLTGVLGSDPRGPKYVAVQSQPSGPFRQMHYGWSETLPVRDGKVWIWTVPTATNEPNRHFLYELKSHRVVGELLNGSAIFANSGQTKLLCEGYSSSEAMKWKLGRWLDKFSLTKGLSQKLNHGQEFWVLDLRNNSAVRVGKVSQAAGMGSQFVPSPGFRYGFNKPTASLGTSDVFLCDLESNLFTKIEVDGFPQGWWDEKSILFKDPLNNFRIFDVVTRETSTVFGATAVSNYLQQLNLPLDALGSAGLVAMCHWNGRDNDILFTQASERNWGRSFLLKADRKDMSLKLLYRDFKFQWGAHLDSDCTLYVYEGESGQPGRGGNGGVYLRNLTNDTTVTLVEPDNAGQYSLVRFCDDGVIYSRKRLLWRVDLNGSNNAPLLPMPAN
jgi:hypothetical protein